MKQTTTPAIKYIDGQPFVRVIDLGHMWHTNTSNILAIGKRHHVPEEQLRRIDGRVWCSFAGLRYRVAATKHGSSIAGRIREFLDAQAEKTEPKPAQATEPAATDLGTAALIADARRTASKAIAKASDNKKRIEKLKKHMDAAESIVKSAANIAEEASEAVDRVEKDAIAHRCDALQRIRQAEHNQRDAAARIGTLEEHARAIDWTLAAVATLAVVGRVVRLLHRR